jgi:Arc/MetJ-type ribon-helix-helix transcriptional regulator
MPKLGKPRKKRTIYIKPELHQWIEDQIGKDKFGNFSHAVEIALEKLRDASQATKSSKENNPTKRYHNV